MKFRSGKYAGKDIEYVRRVAPWYIDWVKLNRPEMLKGVPKKQTDDKIPSAYEDSVWLRSLKPNLDFENQITEIPKRVVAPKRVVESFW